MTSISQKPFALFNRLRRPSRLMLVALMQLPAAIN